MTDISKLSRDQLVRVVEVLRGGLHDVEAADYPYQPEVGRICGEALSVADRIAAEPVEPSIDDLVRAWTTGAPDAWVYVHPEKGDIRLGDLDGYVPFSTLGDAIAWARAQGSVK